MYYKNMEAHGAYPGLPSADISIVKSVAEAPQDRAPSATMQEHLDNVSAGEVASAVHDAEQLARDRESTLNPEQVEILSDMGGVAVGAEIVIDDQLDTLADEPVVQINESGTISTVTTPEIISEENIALINSNLAEPKIVSDTPVEVVAPVEKTDVQIAAEALASSNLSVRLNTRTEAKSEKDRRKDIAEKQKLAVKDRISQDKSELQSAKDARSAVRSRTSIVNRFLDKSQVRGQIVREANRLESDKSFQAIRKLKNSAKSFKLARGIVNKKAQLERSAADARVDDIRQVLRDSKNTKRNLRGTTYGGSSLSYGAVRSDVIDSRAFGSLEDDEKMAHFEARRKALMEKRNSEESKRRAEARRKMINDAKLRGKIHQGKRV